jgi:hypothetical protein
LAENDIIDAINAMRRDLDLKHKSNANRENDMKNVIEGLRDEFKSAFPDGDPATHRRYHETLIKAAEKREKMYDKLYGQLLEKGIWGVILVLVGLLGIGISQIVKGH